MRNQWRNSQKDDENTHIPRNVAAIRAKNCANIPPMGQLFRMSGGTVRGSLEKRQKVQTKGEMVYHSN